MLIMPIRIQQKEINLRIVHLFNEKLDSFTEQLVER